MSEVVAGVSLSLGGEQALDGLRLWVACVTDQGGLPVELLGRNLAGEHLHVIYRRLAGGQIRVFHMSRMTDTQRRRLRRIRG